MLDNLSLEYPIIVFARDLHSGWANTRALVDLGLEEFRDRGAIVRSFFFFLRSLLSLSN
jgi:predicted amidohydrolase YtcJ